MKKLNEVARMQKLAGLNESFDSLVHKLEKGGKSEKAADKIAGAINAKYVHHYREGIEENMEGSVWGDINDQNVYDAICQSDIEQLASTMMEKAESDPSLTLLDFLKDYAYEDEPEYDEDEIEDEE